MNAKTIFTIAAIGVGGYILYRVLKPQTTVGQTANIFQSQGRESYVQPSYFQPKTSYALLKNNNTTYRFGTGDYDKLNFAQKFLLSTHLVPTKWVLE